MEVFSAAAIVRYTDGGKGRAVFRHIFTDARSDPSDVVAPVSHVLTGGHRGGEKAALETSASAAPPTGF